MVDKYCFNQEISTNCIYLVYRIVGNDVIDDIEHNMLTSNNINGLLSVTYCGVDSDRYYKYDISSKITLGNYIQSVVESKKILSIIMHICEALMNTGKYLIENENIILNKDYIYIDITTLEVYMICLPVCSKAKSESNYDIKYFIKDLIFQLRTSEKTDLAVISEIFDYINSNDIILLTNFYSFIKSLANNKDDIKATVENYSLSGGANECTEATSDSKSIDSRTLNKDSGFGIIADAIQNIRDKNDKQDKQEKKEKPDKKEKKVKPPKFIDISNDVNAMKSNKASTSSLVIPNIEKKAEKTAKVAKHTKPAKAVKASSAIKMITIEDESPVNNKKTVKIYGNSKKSLVTSIKGHVMNIFDSCKKTIKSSQPPKTVIQTPEQVDDYVYSEKTEFFDAEKLSVNASPYIIRMSNDEKAYISKDTFRLGKDAAYADFIIKDNPTISRAHAEIIKDNDKYYLQDNNSKNHTYVNDEIVVGSNKLKLSHNTRFRLSNEEFMFKLY